MERADHARRLKDDLELEKVKNRNLETRATKAEKALADEQQKTQNLKIHHEKKLKQVENELQEQKEKAAAREKEFTDEALAIINSFMDTSFFKKWIIVEFIAGGIFYRQECIEAGVDVKPYEGENFNPSEPDPEPPVTIRNLDLLKIREETRKEAEEEARRAQEDQAEE